MLKTRYCWRSSEGEQGSGTEGALIEGIVEKAGTTDEAQAASEQVWLAAEAGGEVVVIQSESGNVAWMHGGEGTSCREEAQSHVYAQRMVAAWNACKGIPSAALHAARTGAVAAILAPLVGKNAKTSMQALQAILDLVRQASGRGGISEHEFSRPGGWRERACRALETLDAACVDGESEVRYVLAEASQVLPFHVFNIEAKLEAGTMRYVISKPGSNSAKAHQAAMAHVLAELKVPEGSETGVIGSVEYLGSAAREFCTSAGPCKG